jgi:hypothetical protein
MPASAPLGPGIAHVLADQSLWENERMWEIFGRRPQDGTISMREFFRTGPSRSKRPAISMVRQAVPASSGPPRRMRVVACRTTG